jgi:hypothetical protein
VQTLWINPLEITTLDKNVCLPPPFGSYEKGKPVVRRGGAKPKGLFSVYLSLYIAGGGSRAAEHSKEGKTLI